MVRTYILNRQIVSIIRSSLTEATCEVMMVHCERFMLQVTAAAQKGTVGCFVPLMNFVMTGFVRLGRPQPHFSGLLTLNHWPQWPDQPGLHMLGTRPTHKDSTPQGYRIV
ncbi:MAG: hypothetical protein DCC55_14625 [Chloroflexi bacterium]|nr:MAG: hypothetical protein DCC55_14625 [Chloroflexota bacterium]